jgi:uncharacterized OB-fold protein
MLEALPPSIEEFYNFIKQRRLRGIKCLNCGRISIPPRTICPKCKLKKFEWVDLKGVGELLTYTIIHVPMAFFKAQTPYVVGVIRLQEGVQIPGILKGVEVDRITIGMKFQVDFESAPVANWPSWARYYFKPAC